MKVPTIHMNGTPKHSLIEGLCQASDALSAAAKQLGACGSQRARLLRAERDRAL